jgi:hypothetical protein
MTSFTLRPGPANRLHAHLVVLLPGYSETVARLVSGRHLAAIECTHDGQAGVRAELARALLAEIRGPLVQTSTVCHRACPKHG